MKRKLITDNPNEALRILLQHFGLKYNQHIEDKYMTYPLYPGFNAVSYIMAYNGIDTCLVETTKEELLDLPMPVLINYDGLFLPISSVSDKEIEILNESGGVDKEDISMLNHLWSGTAMVFNAEKPTQYVKGIKDIVKGVFDKIMLVAACILIAVFFFYLLKINSSAFDVTNYAFYTTTVAGIVISILFQIREYDRNNSFINNLCHSKTDPHGMRDCSSVLDSKDSMLWGVFKWTDISLVYFMYFMLLPIVISPESSRLILAIVSFLASLYIPYSLIYQWRYAHKWCVLCLLTQVVLFVNLIISLFIIDSNSISIINPSHLLYAIITGIATMAFVTIGKRLMDKHMRCQALSEQFQSLKHYPTITETLFSEQKKIDTTQINKIVINDKGNQIVTLVINPVCSPCMKRLRKIFEFYRYKHNTRLELIFLTDEPGSKSFQIASYMMNVYNINPMAFEDHIKKYVNDYPVSSNRIPDMFCSQESDNTIMQHKIWCQNNAIYATPKMFLNACEIPRIYDEDDLDYMIR